MIQSRRISRYQYTPNHQEKNWEETAGSLAFLSFSHGLFWDFGILEIGAGWADEVWTICFFGVGWERRARGFLSERARGEGHSRVHHRGDKGRATLVLGNMRWRPRIMETTKDARKLKRRDPLLSSDAAMQG